MAETVKHAYYRHYDHSKRKEKQWTGGIYELPPDLIKQLSMKVVDENVVMPEKVESCFKRNAGVKGPKKTKVYNGWYTQTLSAELLKFQPWEKGILVQVITDAMSYDMPGQEPHDVRAWKLAEKAKTALEKCAGLVDESRARVADIERKALAESLEVKEGLPEGVVSQFLTKKVRGKDAQVEEKKALAERRVLKEKMAHERDKEEEEPSAQELAERAAGKGPDEKGGRRRTRRRKSKRGTRKH